MENFDARCVRDFICKYIQYKLIGLLMGNNFKNVVLYNGRDEENDKTQLLIRIATSTIEFSAEQSLTAVSW